jgi:hypothetical protein
MCTDQGHESYLPTKSLGELIKYNNLRTTFAAICHRDDTQWTEPCFNRDISRLLWQRKAARILTILDGEPEE